MDLAELIAALNDPHAYPFPTESVDVRQTHISVVILAGDFVYKVKKPVNFGFLDFSTLGRRRHFCNEEVRLNRRLAPGVYLGAAPINRSESGVAVEGSGEVIEWAVKMGRLPDEATLLSRLRIGDAEATLVQTVARRVAEFHSGAAAGDHVAAYGRFDVVAGNARENLTQSAPFIGLTVSQAVHDRVRRLTDDGAGPSSSNHRGSGQARRPTRHARRPPLGPRLRFPPRLPPDDLVIIDCIEFNERFRFADPVADMAFLAMDLKRNGRPDLATAFADAYFTAADDADGRRVFPFYVAYRAAVRGKVEGMEAAEPEVSAAEQRAVL